jgi:hypothetical protein
VSVLQSLRWIFWGVLLAAIAIWINGFDLLNDVLGYAIIAVGMIGLVKNSVGGSYGWLTKLIAIVALLNAAWAPFAECPGRMPLLEKTAGIVLGILNVFATVGFCIVMRKLCNTIPLRYAESSWRTSLLAWRFGLPISLAATYLSWWTTKDEHGMVTANNTPMLVLIPYLALSLITIAVLIHTFISLGRTITGLKGMVNKLPAASDFGLDQPSPFHFQFSIRALMIVTAATAVIAAGVAQRTIPYWQFTMTGLVAVSLLAMWLGHQTLAKGLLIVVAAVVFGGHSQVRCCSGCGAIGGMCVRTAESSSGPLLPKPVLADVEAWLAARGFIKSAAPPDSASIASVAGVHSPEPQVTIWYAQENPSLPHVCINIEYSQIAERLLSVQINYTWHLTDFPWVIHVREGQLRQFANEMAEWLKKYDEELQARRSNS